MKKHLFLIPVLFVLFACSLTAGLMEQNIESVLKKNFTGLQTHDVRGLANLLTSEYKNVEGWYYDSYFNKKNTLVVTWYGDGFKIKVIIKKEILLLYDKEISLLYDFDKKGNLNHAYLEDNFKTCYLNPQQAKKAMKKLNQNYIAPLFKEAVEAVRQDEKIRLLINKYLSGY